MMTHDDKLALEKLIDIYGLHGLMAGLADVCQAKAEHLRVEWQDPQTGHTWDKAANRFANLGTKLDPLF